ncbi:hypothetical protein LCGC14_0351300 [marine sediment metagenome]|uniref:Uncharacterized protein n=1 Tax=marine sediment metagenome TaxID=412755 RepID=A0A0F9VXX5_9ZZZZ
MPNDQLFYYVRGNLLGIVPTPTESTASKATGTVTVSSSTCTDSSAGFGTNTLIQDLVEVNGTLHIIVSNTATTFTVDGTPTAGTYTIYKKGLEIWYLKLPSNLTSDSDSLAGNEIDHWTMVYGVISRVLAMNGQLNESEYYRRLYEDGKEKRRVEKVREAGPLHIQPWNIRSDLK